jgi:hypothetical protein
MGNSYLTAPYKNFKKAAADISDIFGETPSFKLVSYKRNCTIYIF